ncbi:carboxymuconolactone decarboxylase family protein [Shewanella olleyana]|uniref:carboxymuconolactone decarboxylase family protein n=1 Tax=Shewanella olleyana TaxID=135626 RepID=UPI00200EB1D8|nr:carboxymuconolactone decarboxylase family protein [Shewanella olleyana]MCL1068498.1 carboxymuconolactone decarboxylase family protein [Shewanella olleyana]
MLSRISQKSVYSLARIPKNLLALDQVSNDSSVNETIQHLVKLRVSQINHCCYCQHMHSNEARQDGEKQARLDVLPAWREAPCFSVQERAALSWAESLTLISQGEVDDAIYRETLAAFGEKDLLELTTVVLAINSWNRVAVSMQFVPNLEL